MSGKPQWNRAIESSHNRLRLLSIERRPGAGDYGVAVLSRLPIERARLMQYGAAGGVGVSGEAPVLSAALHMDAATQPRGAAAVLLRPWAAEGEQGAEGRAVDRAVWVVTTHLSHKAGSTEQIAQARQLCDWTASLRAEVDGSALVLCGDMNAAAHRRGAWAEITAHGGGAWEDAWELATAAGRAMGTGLTFPSKRPRVRIDQCFLQPSHDSWLRLETMGVLQSDPLASDHLPVLLGVSCRDVDSAVGPNRSRL